MRMNMNRCRKIAESGSHTNQLVCKADPRQRTADHFLARVGHNRLVLKY